MRYTINIVSLLCCFAILGCTKKYIDFDMEDYKPEPVVTSYLEPGKQYEVILNETVPYNSSSGVVAIESAVVRIIYKQREIILTEVRPGYYYSLANELVPEDYSATFYLDITLQDGGKVTSESTIPPPLKIDTVQFTFNGDSVSSCAIKFFEPIEDTSYYHVYFVQYEDYISFSPEKLGHLNTFTSGYGIPKDEEVEVAIIHVTKAYYDYYTSANQAYQSTIRPVVEPGFLKSNINGGIGVFAGVYIYRKKFIAK